MVLVNKMELEKISINLSVSIGEDDPTILAIDSMEKLEKVIEESITGPVIDVIALKGIAEVLELALNATGSAIMTKRFAGQEWSKDITHEEFLEFHIEHAIEAILNLVSDETKNVTHGNE